MTSKPATLRLEPAVHTHVVVDGRVTHQARSHSLDLIVDGVSLRSTVPAAGDLVTELYRSWWSHDGSAADTLLGRRPASDLDPGRIPLLVCGVRGDLACGAITAALDVRPREVTWSDLRWENGYGEPEPDESLAVPLTFDRGQSEAELADVDERVAAPPVDEPLFRESSRRGRPSRWPWQPRTE